MDKFKKLDSIAIVSPKRPGSGGAVILFHSSEFTFHNVTTAEQSAEIDAIVEKAKAATPTERRRLVAYFPEQGARLGGAPFLSPRPTNIRKTAGRPLDDNDDLARLYEFIRKEAEQGRRYRSKKRAVEAFARAGHVPEGQVPSLRNKVTKCGRAFELSRTIRVMRVGRQQGEPDMGNRGGNGGGGGGGGGGRSGGGTGGGRGQGNGGGWPSTTGKPSGGGRSNAPASGGSGSGRGGQGSGGGGK